MTQDEKELLLKDLCARLPYGVIVKVSKEDNGSIKSYNKLFDVEIYNFLLLNGGYMERGIVYHYSQFSLKPYLRPMSSLSKAERAQLEFAQELDTRDAAEISISYVLEFFLENKIDYRGLIPMGLALEAPKDMYN